MDRNEFEQLYLNKPHFMLNQSQIETIKCMRSDWDSFDSLCKSSDITKMISIQDAIEDVNNIFLLLECSYCGYEYYSARYNFNQVKSKLINEISSNYVETISAIDLCKILHQFLASLLNDGHVAVAYGDFEGDFLQSYNPYVTKVVVEKEDEQYIIIKSEELSLLNTRLCRSDIQGELFPTLIPGHYTDCFLIGIYALEDPEYINIAGHKCKTHLLRSCNISSKCSKLYSVEEELDYTIFTNSSYQIYEEFEMHKNNFLKIGMTSASKQYIIWNISGNHGGNSAYPEAFLLGLNGYIQNELDTAILHSPSLGNSEYEKYYEFKKAKETKKSKSTFDGTVYIVMDKATGSSAELAVTFSKLSNDTVTIGSPSAGVGLFGEVRPYRLPSSGIFVLLPYKLFYEADFEVGKGKMPDYWIDNENPVDYLLQFLKGKQ